MSPRCRVLPGLDVLNKDKYTQGPIKCMVRRCLDKIHTITFDYCRKGGYPTEGEYGVDVFL